MKRSMILLLALVALFLAACSSEGGGASATQTASATTEASADAEATPEPDTGTDTEPTMQPGAGDLASILPTEIGGITIEYESSSGDDVIGSDGMTPEAQEIFDRLGAEPSDLSTAFGFGVDQETGSAITIFAFRVAGADEGRLRDEFRASIEADDTQTLSEETVAGKDVLAISADEDSEATGYIYVKNDIAFVVGGSPMSLAEEALAELP